MTDGALMQVALKIQRYDPVAGRRGSSSTTRSTRPTG